MMERFRQTPPAEIADSKVVCAKDYEALTITDGEGNVSPLDMPAKSNVLQWYTADGTKVSVRPSGTEPKIKFYIEVKGTMQKPEDYDAAKADAVKKVDAVKASLGI